MNQMQYMFLIPHKNKRQKHYIKTASPSKVGVKVEIFEDRKKIKITLKIN